MIEKDEAFARLVRASWERRLAEELDRMIGESPEAERPRAAFLLAALCGVSLGAEALAEPGFGERVAAALESGASEAPVVASFGSCANTACQGREGGPPCASSCPFHAIILDPASGEAKIDSGACTGCGRCVEACPDGVFADLVEYLPAAELQRGGRPVIAAVAPAIVGQFGGGATIEKLRTAFKRLGCVDMVEVAFFADMLTMKEAGEFNEKVMVHDDFLISSCCCPMWVAMLRRVYKDLVHHVSPSVSPMIAAGRVLKILRPGCAVVFIGPCIAKKAEAKEADLSGAIDQVLTFHEMKTVFETAGLDPASCEESPAFEYASRGGRLYARAGGVSTAVSEAVAELYPGKAGLFKSTAADGVPACKALLERAKSGQVEASFIEGMGCVGGCVGGPKAILPREAGRAGVDAYAEGSAIPVATKSDCMKEILGRLGIFGPEAIMESGKARLFEREF
jgi:iron only hydrogenase large subunit-like protein